MAAWPTVAQVKESLGVTVASRDAVIGAALGAAIEQVAVDIGYFDIAATDVATVPVLTAAIDVDTAGDPIPAVVIPSYSLSVAALILAVMAVKAPDAPFGVAAVFDTGGLRVAAQHPTYMRMLTGQRQTFGVG